MCFMNMNLGLIFEKILYNKFILIDFLIFIYSIELNIGDYLMLS